MIIKAPSEHTVQAQLISALAYMARPDIYYFAIPNAGKRSFVTARRMIAEGMRAGVSDLVFLFPMPEPQGFLEMKTDKGSLRVEQKGFRAIVERAGHRWAMARSLDEALDVLRGWNALKHGAVKL